MSSDVKLATPLSRVYAVFAQRLFPCLDSRPHFFRWMRMAHCHNVIAPAAGPFQGRRRGAGDPNRRMRLLHRPWVERDLVEAPELPAVTATCAAPGLENDRQRFLHPLLPFLPLDIEHLIVQRGVAGADPELQSAPRYGVHHSVVFGALQRMAQRQNSDARTQANARGPRRGRRQ